MISTDRAAEMAGLHIMLSLLGLVAISAPLVAALGLGRVITF